MLSRRLVPLIENKIFPIFKRYQEGGVEDHGMHLQIKKGHEVDLDETVEFFEETFVQDEPVIRQFKLEDTCDLLRFIKHTVCGSYVIKMVDEECNIMSAAVCRPVFPNSSDKMRTFAECSTCDFKTRRLINFWADVSDSHNLFECFKVKEIWEISFLSTAAEGLGKGLSNVVLAESKILGKKEGFSICRMCCANHYSAKLAESLKFVTLPPRNVFTYRDKKGCPWVPCHMKLPHPHGHVIIAYDFLC